MLKIKKDLLPWGNWRGTLDDKELGFGKIFTDHILTMKWNPEKEWHNATICPHRSLALEPTAMILHYGQGIFEGMKAYWRGSDSFALFRAEENAIRFNRSAERLCMPTIAPSIFLDAIIELIKVDARWIPKSPSCSLYIRPNMIAVEPSLGLRPAKEYLFCVTLSPVGSYFSGGFKPIAIYVEEKMSRVAEGGLGEVKAVANYAASMLASKMARDEGYSQVLWLDACEHRWVEEVGAMNIFFVQSGHTLLTPCLNGNILPGVTRDSVIKIAKRMGMPVVEDYFDINDVIRDIQNGVITEIFGSGTAAVIAPVGKLCYKKKITVLNGEKVGTVTEMFYKSLTDIQYGKSSPSVEYLREDKKIVNWVKTITV